MGRSIIIGIALREALTYLAGANAGTAASSAAQPR